MGGAQGGCRCDGGRDVCASFEDCGPGGGQRGCGQLAEGCDGNAPDHRIEELPDGSAYEGQFLGRDRHGWGKITWAGGDGYEGQFHRNDMHGQGALHWSSGVAYSGQWRRNELGPAGAMRWPDGRSYTGQWVAGRQHGYGFVSVLRGPSHLSQWREGQLERWLAEPELAGLSSREQARAALGSGAVRLLSALWLQERPEGFELQRHQDLPPEAFVPPGDAESLLGKRYGIIVMSYGWLGKFHPDPSGFHTRTLLQYLEKHMEYFSGFDDVGVFWDFASIHQNGPGGEPRSEEEQKIRKIGLRALGSLYGSKKTIVVKLTRMPEGCDLLPYRSRGWCFAESTLASIVKEPDQLLDLGLVSDVLGDIDLCWDELRDGAISSRSPPLLPKEFQAALKGLAFADGDDPALLSEMYAGFFKEAAASTLVLCLANREQGGGWSDAETKMLCRALPSFKVCKAVSLAGHTNLGEAGLNALREVLPKLRNIQRLVLPQRLEQDKEGLALAEQWSAIGKPPEQLIWLRASEDEAKEVKEALPQAIPSCEDDVHEDIPQAIW